MRHPARASSPCVPVPSIKRSMKSAEPLTRTVSAKHPAVRSWSELSGRRPGTARIQLLKNEHDRKVWRLIGLGPGGSNVIAKLNPKADAAAEHRIYHEA